MGYSIDKVTGGVNTLRAINNEVFDPSKEYKLVRGIIIDNFGETGAAIYDIGSLLTAISGLKGNLSGEELNTILNYISTGLNAYGIVEYVEQNIEIED